MAEPKLDKAAQDRKDEIDKRLGAIRSEIARALRAKNADVVTRLEAESKDLEEEVEAIKSGKAAPTKPASQTPAAPSSPAGPTLEPGAQARRVEIESRLKNIPGEIARALRVRNSDDVSRLESEKQALEGELQDILAGKPLVSRPTSAKAAARPSPARAAGPAAAPTPSMTPTPARAPAGPRGWKAISSSNTPEQNLEAIKGAPWLRTGIGQRQFKAAFGEAAFATEWDSVEELARQAKELDDTSIAQTLADKIEELRMQAAAAGPVVTPSPAPSPARTPRASATNIERTRQAMEQARAAFFAEQARQIGEWRKGGNFTTRTLKLRKVREALGIKHKEEWDPQAATAKTAYDQARIAYGTARKAELIAAAGSNEQALARIQGELFQELIVNERVLQERHNATSMPPREQSLWLKGMRWFAKQHVLVRAALSTAVITGGMVAVSSVFGLGLAGAALAAAPARFGKTVVSATLGVVAGKAAGAWWERRIQKTKGGGIQAVERNFTVADLAAIEKQYKEVYDKERSQRVWKLATQAAVGVGAGVTANLLFFDPSLGGVKKEIGPPAPPEDDRMRLMPRPESDKEVDIPHEQDRGEAPPIEGGRKIPSKQIPESRSGRLAPAAPPVPPELTTPASPPEPPALPESPRAAPEAPTTPKDIHPALARIPDEVEVKRGDGWSMVLDREFKKAGLYQDMTLQQRKNLVYGIIHAYGLEKQPMLHPGAIRLSDYNLGKDNLQEAINYARAGKAMPHVTLSDKISQMRIGPVPTPSAPSPSAPSFSGGETQSSPHTETEVTLDEDRARFYPQPEADKVDIPSAAEHGLNSFRPLSEAQEIILAKELLPAMGDLPTPEAVEKLTLMIWEKDIHQSEAQGLRYTSAKEYIGLWTITADEYVKLIDNNGPEYGYSGSKSIETLRRFTGIEPARRESMYDYLTRLVEHVRQKR